MQCALLSLQRSTLGGGASVLLRMTGRDAISLVATVDSICIATIMDGMEQSLGGGATRPQNIPPEIKNKWDVFEWLKIAEVCFAAEYL